MFVVKYDDGKNDHNSYKSIYLNYFLICSNRVKLFLAMQVRVMAACMESQADILECTASAQSGRREVTVCFSPMSMLYLSLLPPPSTKSMLSIFTWIHSSIIKKFAHACCTEAVYVFLLASFCSIRGKRGGGWGVANGFMADIAASPAGCSHASSIVYPGLKKLDRFHLKL